MIFSLDLKSGELKILHRENDWTNHLQCSPADRLRILFCHEGPWHYVDRVWTLRADGTPARLLHERTMNMEIEGHEFFSADGKMVWYDLQTPRSTIFWLAGIDLATGRANEIFRFNELGAGFCEPVRILRNGETILQYQTQQNEAMAKCT